MDFNGHQLFKIDRNWLFDLTTFVGYRVSLNGNKVTDFSKAFTVGLDDRSNSFRFNRVASTPVRVMRKVIDLIQRYLKEAYLVYAD